MDSSVTPMMPPCPACEGQAQQASIPPHEIVLATGFDLLRVGLTDRRARQRAGQTISESASTNS